MRVYIIIAFKLLLVTFVELIDVGIYLKIYILLTISTGFLVGIYLHLFECCF